MIVWATVLNVKIIDWDINENNPLVVKEDIDFGPGGKTKLVTFLKFSAFQKAYAQSYITENFSNYFSRCQKLTQNALMKSIKLVNRQKIVFWIEKNWKH